MRASEFRCRDCGRSFKRFGGNGTIKCPFCSSSKIVETVNKYKICMAPRPKPKFGLEPAKKFL